jgi:flagellar assembly factor FliW
MLQQILKEYKFGLEKEVKKLLDIKQNTQIYVCGVHTW